MIQVREAKKSEWPLVRQIMLEAFEEYRGVLEPPSAALSETPEDVKASLAKGGALLAFLDGNPGGSTRYEIHEGYVYCSRLAVLPSKRGHGLACAMLEAIDEIAKSKGLQETRLSTREVMESNLRLYRRQGFELAARYPHPRGGGIVVDFVKRLS